MAIAAPMEGLRTVAYKDPVGIPTICFGSTRGVKLGDTKTTEECHAMLSSEMREAVDHVERCTSGRLPTPVLAAFSDAAYNMGPTVACDQRNSTAARLLASGEYAKACEQLPRWNKARVAGVLVPLPGLTKRRELERDLCLTGA